MARATIRLDLRPAGASLAVIARELRRMDDTQVKTLFRRHLDEAARPFPAAIRASALAIPAGGRKHTGLRARIAGCVSYSSGTDARSAWASLWIDTRKMLPDYTSLPLYMEGVKEGSRARNYTRWRHPVYGNREKWVGEQSHPYFYQAARPFGRAAGDALHVALEDITRRLSP